MQITDSISENLTGSDIESMVPLTKLITKSDLVFY